MNSPLFTYRDETSVEVVDGATKEVVLHLVTVEADIMYPKYLKIVGLRGTPTQVHLELARQVFTRDLKMTLGPPIHIRIVPDKTKRYALNKFPAGEKPTQAFDAFYKQLSGTAATRLGII